MYQTFHVKITLSDEEVEYVRYIRDYYNRPVGRILPDEISAKDVAVACWLGLHELYFHMKQETLERAQCTSEESNSSL